ncbi:MAG: Maf family protein [Treponema sp.]|nr:Maf family protein [Treponema sp.]
MEQIILASQSPRRKELFTQLGLPFVCFSPELDESFQPGADPFDVVRDLAIRKVKKAADSAPEQPPLWVCGADTLVHCAGITLGKPGSRAEAKTMLGQLQGKTHRVVTAVALYSGRTGFTDCRSDASEVTFAGMDDAEMEWYLDTGEWKDAAGGYKVQGLASCFITKINGSYSNVVGLPLHLLYVMLRDNGYPYGGL